MHKHFPLKSHQFAKLAALATIAADEQNRFWELNDLLYKNYNSLNAEKISALAKGLGLDMQKFDLAVKSPETAAKLRKDVGDALKAGVRGTPAVFINGRELKNRSFQGFQKMIDPILKQP